ncbi:MAG: ATP phosphoribosyltransferase regulatory subunit [Candidatus Sungbacteria bacterium]|uniref:ATP phosphoribosyltransferase regulatory subunit n=1 Tax=Candidatus Sungiibacteriota bacterium TaxID=2750080 RepID=A0A931SBJ6_9BACT|nr:ATP phosphoribosyltransferase regulatory subunit [Candidatus Sungbacteria bacterium]
MTSKEPNEKKLINPALPGGFRDALPEDMIAKNAMMDTIRGVFERFGFDPMETPAVERNEVLVGGEAESDRIIFRVAPAVRGEVKDITRDETSLRFDLTVPLARVHANGH